MPERGTWAASWVPIAAVFPASLSKDSAPEILKDGDTPDAYGLNSDKPGYLAAISSAPVGTVWDGIATVSAPLNAPATATWRYAHGRLWGWSASGATLYYGAYNYTDNYLIQDLGFLPVDSQDSEDIKQVVPFGSNIAIFKDSQLYVIRNADSPQGNFVADYVRQSLGLPVIGDVISVDNKIYWVNTAGVWQYDGQQIVELTATIRNNLGTFVSTAITSLKADFSKKEIIGVSGSTTKFVIVPGDNPELYDYSTSGFRFTTRTLVGVEGEPMVIDRVAFIYQYTGDLAAIDFQCKINDNFRDETQLKVVPDSINGWCEACLENATSCRKFALRITSLSADLNISKILVHVKQGGVQGYSTK